MNSLRSFRVLALSVILLLGICVPVTAAVTGTLPLPPRPANAMTGSEFYNFVLNMTDAQREQAVINEIATGNVPDFIRTLVPVTINATISGTPHTASLFVTPDYMAIGSNSDFFRIPMSAPLAQQVADICGASLPTRKIVNSVYTASTVKLAPYTFSPSTYDIDSIQVMYLHNQAVENQRSGQTLGALVGGIKKDVVITPEITNRPAPARVAIYGWHQLNGSPIQPLSLVHESTYEDYSHGTRLIESNIIVDGNETTIQAVLLNSSLAALLSDEATGYTTANVRYPIPSPYPIVSAGFESPFKDGVGSGWTSWEAIDGTPNQAWVILGPGEANSATVTTSTFGRASANKKSGSYSQYWARTDTTAFDAGVLQRVAVLTGATYEIRAWMKHQSSFAGTSMGFGYDLDGDTDPLIAEYTPIPGTDNGPFVEYVASVVATGPTLTLFARGGHMGTTGDTEAYFYLDDIRVTKTADPATPPTPTNLVSNGSLEDPFTSGVASGWTSWTAAGSSTITFGRASVNKHDGASSQYWSRSDATVFDGGVYQRVAVEAGKTYAIKAWMKRQSTFGGTAMQFGYDLSGGTSGTAGSVVYTNITGATNDVWVQYSATAQATGGFITLFARGGHTGTTGGSNAYFYLDEVSLIETVPPASQPYEHLQNGGFENGFTAGAGTGWSKWNAAGSNTITYGSASVNKQAGAYSQYFSRSDTAPFDGGVYQRVSVIPGRQYAISGWIKRQSTIAGTQMQIGYDLSGGTNGTASSVVYTNLTGSTDNIWTSYNTNVTATSGYLTLFVRGGHTGTTGGTNSYFYADSFSVFGE